MQPHQYNNQTPDYARTLKNGEQASRLFSRRDARPATQLTLEPA